MNEKKIAAAFILFCHEQGIKVKSQYDLENLCHDVLTQHSSYDGLFYNSDTDTELDPIVEAKKFLKDNG